MKEKDIPQAEFDSIISPRKAVKVARSQQPQASGAEDPMEKLDEKDLQITRWIQQMPDLEPPSKLLGSVMEAIQPRKLSWRHRLYRWAMSPKSITFTPLRVASAAVFVIGIFVAGLLIFGRSDPRLERPEQQRIAVVFNLRAPEAHSVSIVGTFNGWNAQGSEMYPDKEHKIWSLTLHLPEGRYEYAFLVDGQRILADPAALLYQDDGFGNENSVLVLRATDENHT